MIPTVGLGHGISPRCRVSPIEKAPRRNWNVRGAAHPHVRMSVEKYREVRALKGQKLQREVAAMYGIDQTLVSRIWRGEHWSCET